MSQCASPRRAQPISSSHLQHSAALQQQEVTAENVQRTARRPAACSSSSSSSSSGRTRQASVRTETQSLESRSSSQAEMKNSNAVAVERRVDLASLFCMIGRHGPAVALAVVAMVSVLAAFIIYRTVRGKRRKATATATAADGDSRSPGAVTDAPSSRARHDPSPEESTSSAGSTDVSDEAPSDGKEDAYLIQSHPNIRLRRAAPDQKKPPPPESDKHAATDDTQMFKVEHKNEDQTTDKDVSGKRTRQEEENLQHALNRPAYCDETPHMSENIDDRLRDNECSPETNNEQPVVQSKHVPSPLICYDKDEKCKEEMNPPEVTLHNTHAGNNQLSSKEEKNEGKDEVMTPVEDINGADDGGPASDVTEDVLDKDHLNNFPAVSFGTNSPELDKQEVETVKQKDGLTCHPANVLPIEVDRVKEKMVTSDIIAGRGEECDSSSLVPSSSLPCLSEPLKVDDHSPPGTTDAKAQVSGIFEFEDCQRVQIEVKEDQSDLVFPKKEIQCEKNESVDHQDQQTMMNDDAFDEASDTTAPDTYACDENIVAPTPAEVSCPRVLSCYKDQQCFQMINNEVFDSCLNLPSISEVQQSDHMENVEESIKSRADSATDAAAYDNATTTAPITSECASRPDTLPSIGHQQSDQVHNNEGFSEVTSGLAPVLTNDICKMNLLSFEQSQLRDHDKDNTSYPGVGVESGISSMAVSPDLQDAGNEFDMLTSDDVASSGTAFESYQSDFLQKPHSEPTDWAKYESSAANEDMFGHEIEDRYHGALDQFMAQIATSVTTFTSELKKKTEIKCVIEGTEVKGCSGVSAQKKVEVETEKEEEYEKTEISIMEATMDNNEWITDSNYHVLPWMNISVSSSAQDNTKTSQTPTDKTHSSPLTDAACKVTDTTPSTEVKPTNTLSLIEDNTENSKKVVAVQPMPQSVNVTFRIHYLTCSPYQTVAVTGNQQELGNWKEFIPLERIKDGHWATVISLPAESHVEWKFVVLDKGEVCRWEECGNRLLETGFGDDLIVHKWWGLL